MDMENLVPEEEEGVLLLTDENGDEIAFEYLDCIEYEGKEYKKHYYELHREELLRKQREYDRTHKRRRHRRKKTG